MVTLHRLPCLYTNNNNNNNKAKDCLKDDTLISYNDRIEKTTTTTTTKNKNNNNNNNKNTCCITNAYLQWLFHSGERAVARGPLVKCPGPLFSATMLLFFDDRKPAENSKWVNFYIGVILVWIMMILFHFILWCFRSDWKKIWTFWWPRSCRKMS